MYALLVASDEDHPAAREVLESHSTPSGALVTHNYVIVETAALLQSRVGTAAVRSLVEDLSPLLRILWVDAELHAGALAVVAAGPRRISLVDRVSFTLMRQRGIRRAFAFDDDFAEAGFEPVPAGPP